MNKTNEYKWGVVSKYGDFHIPDQVVSLKNNGVLIERIIVERIPVLNEEIRFGDTLVVSQIKCLGKTTKQCVDYLLQLDEEGVVFRVNTGVIS